MIESNKIQETIENTTQKLWKQIQDNPQLSPLDNDYEILLVVKDISYAIKCNWHNMKYITPSFIKEKLYQILLSELHYGTWCDNKLIEAIYCNIIANAYIKVNKYD